MSDDQSDAMGEWLKDAPILTRWIRAYCVQFDKAVTEHEKLVPFDAGGIVKNPDLLSYN